MNNINKYYYDLCIMLLIPKGYHNFYFKKDNNQKILITIESTSQLIGINLLIPYINNNFYSVYNSIITILRNDVKIDKDIIFEDYIYEESKIVFIFTEIINLLNPFIITVDILRIIIKYLNIKDVNNLLLSININKYTYLLKDLNIIYIDKSKHINDSKNLIVF